MTYIPRLSNEQLDDSHFIRSELLKYVDDQDYDLDSDVALQASMIIGNYELFHKRVEHL